MIQGMQWGPVFRTLSWSGPKGQNGPEKVLISPQSWCFYYIYLVNYWWIWTQLACILLYTLPCPIIRWCQTQPCLLLSLVFPDVTTVPEAPLGIFLCRYLSQIAFVWVKSEKKGPKTRIRDKSAYSRQVHICSIKAWRRRNSTQSLPHLILQ